MEWLEINGAVLRVAVEGSGPPLVLVHEIGGMIESYDDIVPALASQHKVVRYDIRGSGLSEFAHVPLTIELLVEDLRVLLDRLTLPRVSIAGSAVGAAVAVAFALAYPERVHSLVAMSPALGLPKERRTQAQVRADVFEKEGMRPTQEARLASSYPEALRSDRERYERVFRRRLSANPYGVAALIRVLAGLDLIDRLPQVPRPMLVLAGTYDGDRPPAVVKPVAEAVPNAKYLEIASGHFMASQTPSLVSEAILDFLSSDRKS